MNEVFIKVKNTYLEDLFDKDYITIEELFCIVEDLKSEVEEWKEKYEDAVEQREEFYKPLSPYEYLGVSERDFV